MSLDISSLAICQGTHERHKEIRSLRAKGLVGLEGSIQAIASLSASVADITLLQAWLPPN